MVQVREYGEVSAPAAQVWELIGDFQGFVEAVVEGRGGWVEVEGEGVGALRWVVLGDEVIVERLESWEPANWRTSYSMPVSGPFPVSDYRAVIQLRPVGPDACAVDWVGTFEPDGVTEEVAVAALRAVYVEGIAVVQRRFTT